MFPHDTEYYGGLPLSKKRQMGPFIVRAAEIVADEAEHYYRSRYLDLRVEFPYKSPSELHTTVLEDRQFVNPSSKTRPARRISVDEFIRLATGFLSEVITSNPDRRGLKLNVELKQCHDKVTLISANWFDKLTRIHQETLQGL